MLVNHDVYEKTHIAHAITDPRNTSEKFYTSASINLFTLLDYSSQSWDVMPIILTFQVQERVECRP